MNNEEIWKDIIGYEGLYQVSSLGRVRSLDRYDKRNRFLKGRILKLQTDKYGYLNVQLYSNGKGKNYLVHRLVAEAFIPNPYNLPQVNHKDEDKTNNRVENLEICDAKYNSNYGSRKDRVRDTKIKNGTYTGLSEKEYFKRYWNEHREHLKEYRREYNQKKRDHIKEYYKKYYQEHKNEYNERQKEYRRKQKEQIQNNV